MAKSTTKTSNQKEFTPTFRKYKEMTVSEQACFRQGAKTLENRVKENLGLVKPKNKN